MDNIFCHLPPGQCFEASSGKRVRELWRVKSTSMYCGNPPLPPPPSDLLLLLPWSKLWLLVNTVFFGQNCDFWSKLCRVKTSSRNHIFPPTYCCCCLGHISHLTSLIPITIVGILTLLAFIIIIQQAVRKRIPVRRSVAFQPPTFPPESGVLTSSNGKVDFPFVLLLFTIMM